MCFKEFPDQCIGCPEYTEVRHDRTAEIAWLSGTGLFSPPQFARKIIKECKRYHKRKVEYVT
ncbi:MAG: hypothetical protein ABSF44_02145 [Candidatus Bathyarchaeia archaeon]